MAHLHSVYDTDSHFSINIVTRLLKNEASQKVTVMQYDHNSERFTFEIPRYIEEHDMTLCNVVEVHYKNGETSGMYIVDDLQISPESDDVVICSWLISANATQYAAPLEFRLTFKCVADDGTIDYAWSTAMFKGISVSSGINSGDAIEATYPDAIADLFVRITAAEANSSSVTRIESLDTSNKVCFRDIETGIYILYGYFTPFPDSNSTVIVDNLLMHVYTNDSYTYMSTITADGVVTVYEVLVDDTNDYGYTYQRIKYNFGSYVKTVNDVAPDENGNVAITVPTNTEEWTFTLEDGSTVTKAVYVA